MGIAGYHDSLKEALGSDVVFSCNIYQYFRLEDEGTDACRKSRKQKRDERGGLAVDEPSCKNRNEHRKQGDIETMTQTSKILADIHRFGIIAESDDEIEYQREQDAWYGGIEHVANMREKIGTGDRKSVV